MAGARYDVAELGGKGYNAGTGWDAVTSLGTPNAANLLPAPAADLGNVQQQNGNNNGNGN
jgi:hypothetical protein